MMESPTASSDSPLDTDEVAYPCKGCGDILEEGKAFELAGNRWHIDCFRCNTCNTLLDSDANLLLLGDNSLICNNCTYSCSSCGNKIEDLAILTGDQAFCANCFKCRNCKKKIENLRYARTSQGIFCMECHEALMARRRKRTPRNAAQRQKTTMNNNVLLDKSLPSLPPSAAPATSFSPEIETPPSETQSETPTEVLSRLRPSRRDRHDGSRGGSKERREPSPANSRSNSRDALNIPHVSGNRRPSLMSQKSEGESADADEFLIPVAFDPTSPAPSSPQLSNHPSTRAENRDYFVTPKPEGQVARRPSGGTPNSPTGTPHIAYQEKGRVPSEDMIDSIMKRREGSFSANGSATTSPVIGPGQPRQQYATPLHTTQNNRGASPEERFKLQEVPRTRRSGGSARSSKSGPPPPPAGVTPALGSQNHEPDTASGTLAGNAFVVQEPESFMTPNTSSLPPSQEYNRGDSVAVDSSAQQSSMGKLKYPPKRGDSLESSKVGQSIPRKEVPTVVSKLQDPPQISSDPSLTSTPPMTALDHAGASEKVNGGKIISRPFGSPQSKSIFDTSITTAGDAFSSNPNGAFVASRPPPTQPTEPTQSRHEPSGSSQPEALRSGERPITPGLPRWSAGGEFSMDEDMARILGGDDSQAHESFLRRVSNSVRHGRSFSDKGLRASREHKWPISPTTQVSVAGQEIGSPITASPEHRDELGWFKNELRRERQRTVERDQRIAELESTLHSQANIKQVNTELREKRSTIVVLDAQKDMVVRELEVLTEHIAAANKSGNPLDLSKMTHAVMRDFAESLQKLKDSFAPEIEEFIQKRNELMDEVSNLAQMKDKSFQEFEQLSIKNAQLAELNNQLVRQIQELYKANSGVQAEPSRGPPNGLGIYAHHKDKSQISIESREARPHANEMSWTSGTTLQQEEAEPVTVMQGPQVVNIPKGSIKKFKWGQNVAKGVTKGIKVAFSSTQATYSREMQFTETVPYGATGPSMNEHANAGPRHGSSEPPRPFVLFGGNQKLAGKGHSHWQPLSNGSSPALTVDASTTLFGSDLEARAEFEKTSVPFIVTRCVEEVELRGMDVEGIYRKAGGASQVQAIKDSFETTPQHNSDISDPDLDIHAVSSALKQYFRRLPNPLITYEVYDRLLETIAISPFDAKIDAMSRAVMELPRVHREVLEFLVGHLKRVVGHERENLMTSMNVAVVFAPTIMRPESLAREMTDTQVKNETVQFLVENCQAVFRGLQR